MEELAVASEFTFARRTSDGVQYTSNIAELFPDWKGADECWLFASPHDDDIVIGAGLTLQLGLALGAKVHAMIATDGRMGYCRLAQRLTIAKVRMEEAKKSFEALGLPPDNLRFLGYPDCNLNTYRGRCLSTDGSPTEIEGAGGLQNAITYVLRQVRPTRVFIPTITDLHPDHRIINEELQISLFHAEGNIWPELGDPTPVPKVYEFAIYCDFPEPPQIRIQTPTSMLATKLEGIRAYASQEQIGTVIDIQQKAGPVEYLRDMEFKFYSPGQYDSLFAKKS
jgi:LmbE family N-acetylglucosaminyl deacetylase